MLPEIERSIRVSVILCCFNAGDRLLGTLTHLAGQCGVDFRDFEIVVVDNNSSDDSIGEARRVLSQTKLEWVLVSEKTQGLAFARAAGYRASRGVYLVFCDDDNWLSPDYLLNAMTFLDANPAHGAAAGYGEAVSKEPIPEWFADVSRMYACDSLAEDDLNAIALAGAGLVMRKRAVEMFSAEQVEMALTDRLGTALSSGGDAELSCLLRVAGWRLAKLSSLRFAHYMPKNRLTPAYAVRLSSGIGEALPILDFYSLMDRHEALARTPFGLAAFNVYHCVRWFGQYLLGVGPGFKKSVLRARARGVFKTIFRSDTIALQHRAVLNVHKCRGKAVVSH